MTDTSLASFAAGMGVGLAVAVPIGPMGILCIQRTLAHGLEAGFATGLGAATVHVALGSMATLGLWTSMADWVGSGAQVFSILSAGLLFWFAVRIMRRSIVVGSGETRPEGWLRLYGSAILFGFSNPLAIVLFAAALPAFMAGSDPAAAPLLVPGVFLGSITWWICLSATTALLRSRLSSRMIGTANKASGILLAALGTLTVANAMGLRLP